jgi:hypothetical protein
MSITSIDKLKSYFKTGAKPTQEQFHALLDSYIHKSEDTSYILQGLAGATFMGVATPDSVPPVPTQKVFYIANEVGSYPNYGGLAVADGEIAFFTYNGSWSKVALGDVAKKSYVDEKVGELEAETKLLTSYNYFSDQSELSDGYINPDGFISENTQCSITPYIQVKAGQKWRYDGRTGVSHKAVWGYAGAMKIPIVEGLRDPMTADFTIPDGVETIRAWSWKDAPTKSLLCKDTMAFKALQLSLSQEENIVELQKNSSKKILISKNLFNLSKSIDGYYVDYSTGVRIANTEFFVSEYIQIKPNTSYIMNITQQVAFYNSNKQYVSGIMAVKEGVSFTSPDEAAYIVICYYIALKNSVVLNEGTIVIKEPYALGFDDIYIRKENILGLQESTTSITKVIATRNTADYNSIRDLMDKLSLTADESHKFQIIIPKGRWFESDIKGHPHIELIGEDKDETILYCDGTSNNLTPADYSYSAYANRPLSEIDYNYKHCVFVRDNIHLENLTIEVNNAKYCIHCDKTGKRKGFFRNCKCVTFNEVNAALGMGIWGNQSFEFESCEFVRKVGAAYCVYLHNWNNQDSTSSVKFKNCYFSHDYILITELGSEYSCSVNLNNCVSGVDSPIIKCGVEKKSNGESYWVNPSTGETVTDLKLVPYSIKINYIGTEIAGISQNNRPQILEYVIGKNKKIL